MKITHVVVLGGTGFVGRAVCEKLVERNGGGGGRIVVPTRRVTNGVWLQSLPTLEIVERDVHDDAALGQLLARAEAVINLVGVLHGSRAEFERIHAELPRRLARLGAGRDRRVVHVGALGAAPDAPSEYLRSKAAGEAALQGPATTILRPSVIFGAEDHFTNLFAHLQTFVPVLPLAGAAARFQPVWVDDVAGAIVRCLDRPQTAGQTYELVGPTVYTLSELVRLAGRWSGHERPQIALPAFAGRAQATFLERLPGAPLMSRDNLDSMQVPNVASGRLPGLDELGIVASSLEALAPGYLGTASGRARLERWRALRGA